MQHIETEVKFFLEDPRALRRHLGNHLSPKTDRRLETNLRLDDAQGTLGRRPALLRLRRDDQVTLTFKSSVHNADPTVKSRHEAEVTVSDFATMRHILSQLGFETTQIYEKYRQEWNAGETVLCFDEMPFGVFLEIEGPVTAIRDQASRLGLDWSYRILTNYLSIFAALKSEFKLQFNDLTFANFAPLALPDERVQAVIDRFRARHH